MIFGYIDIVIFAFLIFLNIRYWNKEFNWKYGFLISIIAFAFVFPIISQVVEIQRVKMTVGIIDNFEVLYTYLRFPTYWLIGVAQMAVVGIKFGSRIN